VLCTWGAPGPCLELAVETRVSICYDFGTLNAEEVYVENATLEQRMTLVENAVRELQEAMRSRRPAADWLDRVIGSMKNQPAFDDVLALGQAARLVDRPAEDSGS